MSKQQLLICKETRANEQRVSLIPKDIKVLINSGFVVYIENNAGVNAGYSNDDYLNVGASIRKLPSETIEGYQALFQDIDIIVRAKRPETKRETLENKSIQAGTIMIGALDPLEKNSTHIKEYRQANITAYSIDQLQLDSNDPMNILAAMGKLTGMLALQDAIEHCKKEINNIVLIGYGQVGRSAFKEATQQQLATTVILSNAKHADEISSQGGNAILLKRQGALSEQQRIIKEIVQDADIVICSARAPKQTAPLLLPADTLMSMHPRSVVLDMAIAEGGNVEGSEHDKTLTLGNEVLVRNVSGYPKALPHETSIAWSRATLAFIKNLDSKTITEQALATKLDQ